MNTRRDFIKTLGLTGIGALLAPVLVFRKQAQPTINPEWEKLGPGADVRFYGQPRIWIQGDVQWMHVTDNSTHFWGDIPYTIHKAN